MKKIKNMSMDIAGLTFKTKTATEEEIYSHLNQCNDNFKQLLNLKINIRKYSEKIFKKSVTFEAWENQILIGLVAAYFNDLIQLSGYITNVSIIMKHEGEGIASELLNICIKYAKQYNFKEIKLEVSKDNQRAINLYHKFRFLDVEYKNDLIVMRLQIVN